MGKIFKFADLGEGITEGEIVHWLVSPGTTVQVDQPLLEIETDKAIVPVTSPFAGKISAVHGKEGETIQVGHILVEFAEEGAQVHPSLFAGNGRKKKDAGSVVGHLEEAPEETEEPGSASPDIQRELSGSEPGRRARAIPSVRTLAKKLNIEISKVRGTGPEGRVRREDIEKQGSRPSVSPQGKSEEAEERIAFKGMRRSAARQVAESVHKIPHVTFMDRADMTRLQEVREQQKGMEEKQGIKLTFLPFIIKAVIAGLKAFPYFNSSLDEERQEIILKKYYHMGIAVDTPNGLIVFAIRNADQKNILELARELSDLSRKAAERTIDLKDLKGSTFTLTNYGVIGGIYGTPIINYPEAAILGIGKIDDQPVVRDGLVTVRKIAPLSLSFDHRLIDGGDAGRFLNVIIAHMEKPTLL